MQLLHVMPTIRRLDIVDLWCRSRKLAGRSCGLECCLRMDLMHYSERISYAMHCGYFVPVKIVLCRHYPVLKDMAI